MPIILVIGPARSGKSAYAETLATQYQQPVTYIATARNSLEDSEWQVRIDRHRQQRPASWSTLEVPLELPEAIASAVSGQTYLIDSLGTWVANWLEMNDGVWQEQVSRLLATLQTCEANCIFVGEEVGWSVVPPYPMGRLFRDRLGVLNQLIGARSDAVYLVAAGFAIDLKRVGIPVSQGFKLYPEP